jgi:inner membrane protein
MNDKIKSFFSTTGAKPFLIVILLLLFLIPISFIDSLMHDRLSYQKQAVESILQPLGGNLELQGIVIALPYMDFVEKQDGDKVIKQEVKKYVLLSPENFDISGNVETYYLTRGIYKVPVFNGSFSFESSFNPKNFYTEMFLNKNYIYEQGVVILGISNKKNLTKLPELQCENIVLNQLSVELDKVSPFNKSIYYKLPKEFFTKDFSIKGTMNVQGGEFLKIQPIATNNTFKISSNWESPSFTGGWLPVNRSISDNGFSAEWNIPGMTTNFPKTWISDTMRISEYVKISFITPVDAYQKAFRSIKYALLFLLVPFLAIFICEIFTKMKIHPVQYCLLGLADVLFYLLLLSFSEHISFGFSYFLASFAVTLSTIFYSASIFKKLKWGLMLGSVQVVSYILLFGTLQAEDYALLIGSIGLFVIVVLLMILTRKIDWYEINVSNK